MQEKNMDKHNKIYTDARKIFEPFILPSIKDYVEPPKEYDNSESSKNSQLTKNSLLISESSVPKIEQNLIQVCKKLKINRELVNAYVFPKMDIEAFAYSNKLPITIALSAGAISRLDEQQLNFVIGHEIGHALIGSIINYNDASKTLEDYIFSRAMEISADRIGLMATNSIDDAQRAILKLLSGLDDEYIEGSNIHNVFSENEVIVSEEDSYSEHPPLIIRLQSLYSLSICSEYNDLIGKPENGSTKLDVVNKTVQEALEKTSDVFALDKIEQKVQELAIWPITLLIFKKLKVDMTELSKNLEVKISKEDIQKAFNFINSYSEFEKGDVLHEKIINGLKDCQSLAPRRTEKFYKAFSKLFPTVLFTNKEFIKQSTE